MQTKVKFNISRRERLHLFLSLEAGGHATLDDIHTKVNECVKHHRNIAARVVAVYSCLYRLIYN